MTKLRPNQPVCWSVTLPKALCHFAGVWVAACALAPRVTFAQDSLPLHALADPSVRSPVLLHSVAGLRELSDGRVLVGDVADKRTLLFDRTLTRDTVVLDGNDGKMSGWQPPGTLIPYRGDSTLIVYGADVTLQLIEPNGKPGRTLAFPIAADAAKVLPLDGQPLLDRRGRLIYRGTLPTNGSLMRDKPDSAPLLRVQLSPRHVDTLTYVKVRGERIERAPAGVTPPVLVTIHPLAPMDDWVAFDDGTVAVVRATDYHIDWFRPDGTHGPSAPIAFRPIPFPRPNLIAALTRMQDSLQTNPAYKVVFALDDLPAVVPAFRGNTAKADASGNIWVLRFHPEAPTAGPIYDVISPAGALINRVQLPAGRTLAGFGRGVVYLAAADGSGIHLERVALP